jgi:hypothetical protein
MVAWKKASNSRFFKDKQWRVVCVWSLIIGPRWTQSGIAPTVGKVKAVQFETMCGVKCTSCTLNVWGVILAVAN